MNKSIIIPRDIFEKVQETMLNISYGWMYIKDLSGNSGGAPGFSKIIYQDDAMDINSLDEDDYKCIDSLQYLLNYLIETEESFNADDFLLRVRLTRTYNYPAEIDEGYHYDSYTKDDSNELFDIKTVIMYINDIGDAKCGTEYFVDDTVHKVYHKEGTCVLLDGDVLHKRFFEEEVKERVVLNINISK